eukprot:CAMPEP_0202891964 /NCGR_PEP_ID=MMETSP1392-20130828/1858_1 /ASSEMBLY_ACC=CAM_ASM_000868 /TAXON_ID=225041 /ORGANISM="Chlamydomonas chlamydogama, Strain SAG 11-48b" /LENGTH=325 /DNA_ID=CAMNT_0049575839 /DNA_START=25 /DNA_END=1002 /DNA_ORIENTATION=+
MSELQVPVVDLSGTDPASCARQAEEIRKASLETGFFYVSNHGIDKDVLDNVFEAQREFFRLPVEEKLTIKADVNNRGYTPMAEETLDPANQKSGDTKEGLYFGRHVDPDSEEAKKPLHGPNQWPSEELVPGYRARTEVYFEQVKALSNRLVHLIATSLGLPADFFNPYFNPPVTVLRPLRYAPVKSDPGEGLFGCGAHSDYGMITVLATDEVPGLQLHINGSWVDVAPLPGCLIINLGDMLERWTNGTYKSTLHRVVNSRGAERFSIAFFFEPSFDALVEVLPGCCSPDQPPRYEPITFGQHILNKYTATHAGYTGPGQATALKT